MDDRDILNELCNKASIEAFEDMAKDHQKTVDDLLARIEQKMREFVSLSKNPVEASISLMEIILDADKIGLLELMTTAANVQPSDERTRARIMIDVILLSCRLGARYTVGFAMKDLASKFFKNEDVDPASN